METNRRTVARIFGWACLSMTVANMFFTVVFCMVAGWDKFWWYFQVILAGNIPLTILLNFIKYFYERAWLRVRWGYIEEVKQYVKGRQ